MKSLYKHRVSERGAQNLRSYLQKTFNERHVRNSQYSLRSFAKSLHISSSTLSEILNGRRPITEKMKHRLGEHLGLSQEEINRFGHDPSKKKALTCKPGPVIQLDDDIFALIADWYHYAILELTRVKGFESSVAYVAEALDIKESEALAAVERLFRLKFLTKNESGRWIDATLEKGLITNIHEKISSTANKKMQKQILELSLKMLLSKPLDIRNHTSMTLALDIKDLPRAIEKIKKFRRSLGYQLSRIRNPTHVYGFHIGLYPLSKVVS